MCICTFEELLSCLFVCLCGFVMGGLVRCLSQVEAGDNSSRSLSNKHETSAQTVITSISCHIIGVLDENAVSGVNKKFGKCQMNSNENNTFVSIIPGQIYARVTHENSLTS